MDDHQIQTVVNQVLQELKSSPSTSLDVVSSTSGNSGIFDTMEEAIAAGKEAQSKLELMPLEERGMIIQAIRKVAVDSAEDFSKRTMEETGMGRVEHKIVKHHNAGKLTPGIEILNTQAFTGDHGLTIEEMGPFGLIGAVTPSTHPVPTLINNAISFIAGGNTAVFNPHPAGKKVFTYAVTLLNQAMMKAGAPANCIACVGEPTIESAQVMFSHPDVSVLLITGGPGVVKEALKAPKRAICAGPGNPPVVVDETADLARAARSIVDGGAFDNNVLCIAEKMVFCVNDVFDRLKEEFLKYHSIELNSKQIADLSEKAFGVKDAKNCAGARLSRELVGKDASVLAKSIGLSVPDSTLMLIGETDFEHVFVQEEQMMPFIPLVRCRNVDEAINMSVAAEHGFRHTSLIHSVNVATMSYMAKRAKTTLFIKNGPCYAGLGSGGEGYPSFSIATPTGEGVTSAATFTRKRRCVLVDYFRII